MRVNCNYNKYIDYLNNLSNDDLQNIITNYENKFIGLWNEKRVRLISSFFEQIFIKNKFSNKCLINDIIIEKFKFISNYINDNGFYWDVECKYDDYVIINYSGNKFFIFDKFIEVIPEIDYSNYSTSEIKSMFLNTDNEISSLSNLHDVSINSIINKKEYINTRVDALKNEIDDVRNNKIEELAKIQKEIDEKINELNSKKELLMSKLNDEMNSYKETINELKKQLYMLKVDIYSIRCYAGDTIELIKIRNGNNADELTPLVINQKILYLDEDLAKVLSIYNTQISNNYKLLEEALKYNDECLNLFCPQSKCITFFKCSKSSKNFTYNHDDGILESYNMLHGNKMGFIVKNSENVYIGWMEESWDHDEIENNDYVLSFNDSVIYKPENKILYNDDKIQDATPIGEVVSRLFAINVVQGLISHKNILNLPKNINLFKANDHVVYNYADAWISDKRYGDFHTLVSNLKYHNRVGDKILVIVSTQENNFDTYGGNRSIGERNNTRECSLGSGIYDINVIDNDKVYVSVKKDNYWYKYKNNSNYEVFNNEYINLTYFNSNWIKYFIETKEIGNFSTYRNSNGVYKSLEYSYLIKYFKIAYEFLLERENEEKKIISKYVDLIKYNNWLDLLSYWKIYNKVRNINEFQAKRFSKYLLSNKHYNIKHLFEPMPSIEYFSLARYYITSIDGFNSSSRYILENIDKPEFGWSNNPLVDTDLKFTLNSDENIVSARKDIDLLKLNYELKEIKKYSYSNNINLNDKRIHSNIIDKINKSNIHWFNNAIFIKFWNEIVNTNYKINEDSLTNLIKIIKDEFNDDEQYYRLYRMYKNASDSLYVLIIIRLIQTEILPRVVNTIHDEILYNYMNEIDFIN